MDYHLVLLKSMNCCSLEVLCGSLTVGYSLFAFLFFSKSGICYLSLRKRYGRCLINLFVYSLSKPKLSNYPLKDIKLLYSITSCNLLLFCFRP